MSHSLAGAGKARFIETRRLQRTRAPSRFPHPARARVFSSTRQRATLGVFRRILGEGIARSWPILFGPCSIRKLLETKTVTSRPGEQHKQAVARLCAPGIAKLLQYPLLHANWIHGALIAEALTDSTDKTEA